LHGLWCHFNGEAEVQDTPGLNSVLVSRLLDRRIGCWSFLLETTTERYVQLAETAYDQRGGLRHQRESLKTTSARRIRDRMIEDIKKGAVLPPVVIGVVGGEDYVTELRSLTSEAIVGSIFANYKAELAIIDGMQRTTAMLEAVDQQPNVKSFPVRLEIWIASSTDSLIYRMLILNTGQVPWNLKQQLQVVYEPLVSSIEKKIRFARFLRRNERRWNGGEFSADAMIEAYIAFGLRRTEVDTQEALADEFSRLDMADALTEKKYDHFFYNVVQMMVDFDIAISRFNPQTEDDRGAELPIGREYSRGRNVLDTQPARIGFIVCHAVAILGRIGMDRGESKSVERLQSLQEACNATTIRINKMEIVELERFLALDVLAEVVRRRPTSAVGRWERSFFESAFKVLVEENYQVPSLETCWRA